eukprot:gene15193-20465_t
MSLAWLIQGLTMLITFFCVSYFMIENSGYFGGNKVFINLPLICDGPAYPVWMKQFYFFLFGATAGRTINAVFRAIMSVFGMDGNDGDFKHPAASRMMLLISIIQTFCFGAIYFDFLGSKTCVDFLGRRTLPFTWIEWLSTVPYMFFLCCMMDSKRTEMRIVDIQVQVSGLLSMWFLFMCNFSIVLPWPLPLLLFIMANICMCYSLIYQQFNAYEEQLAAKAVYRDESMKKNVSEHLLQDLNNNIKIANCKVNCASFMSIAFTLIPATYYIHYLGFFNHETFHLILATLSFLTKTVFISTITDSHVELLDPNKFLLQEERKRAEQSRLMFLRYVFHEVRVPLNSVSLGIQYLFESPHLQGSERETICVIKDAAAYMAETLNDVLSIQKIEEGMLNLEYKHFLPESLVNSVLATFKSQYTAKSIKVVAIYEENAPKVVFADQFRLEHVLGNFLSNAIKFSDENSEIHIIISYETKLLKHVTFSVRDFGPGMTKEEQQLLFQPFMQIRPGELQKGRGTGLGLSICKDIINLHKGAIGCNSQNRMIENNNNQNNNENNSSGSEFFFSIFHDSDKLEKPHEPSNSTGSDVYNHNNIQNNKSSANAAIELWAATSKNLNNSNSLSANSTPFASHDDAHTHNMASNTNITQPNQSLGKSNSKQSILLSENNPISTPSNSMGELNVMIVDEAIQVVSERGANFFDVIFMDSIMPIRCGPETASWLREYGYRNLIIGVTGNAMDEDIAAFESAGADCVLAKPMKMDHLELLLEYCKLHGCRSAFSSNIAP